MDRDNRLYCEYFSVVFIFKLRDMKDIIEKWELILQKDLDNNISYGRNVLIEMLNDFKSLQGEQESKVRITKVVCPDCKNEEGIKYNAFTNTHTCKCGKRWLAFTKQPIEGEQVDKCYPDMEADGIVFCGKCGKMK